MSIEKKLLEVRESKQLTDSKKRMIAVNIMSDSRVVKYLGHPLAWGRCIELARMYANNQITQSEMINSVEYLPDAGRWESESNYLDECPMSSNWGIRDIARMAAACTCEPYAKDAVYLTLHTVNRLYEATGDAEILTALKECVGNKF